MSKSLSHTSLSYSKRLMHLQIHFCFKKKSILKKSLGKPFYPLSLKGWTKIWSSKPDLTFHHYLSRTFPDTLEEIDTLLGSFSTRGPSGFPEWENFSFYVAVSKLTLTKVSVLSVPVWLTSKKETILWGITYWLATTSKLRGLS